MVITKTKLGWQTKGMMQVKYVIQNCFQRTDYDLYVCGDDISI
jgi:hypothetical protein